MEKKINIKLFEEFKNDLVIANTEIKSILQFIIDNLNNFKYERGKGYSYQNYTMYATAPEFPESTTFTIEFEIHTNNNNDVDKIVDFIANISYTGGNLVNDETSTNPAEYNNVEFEINDINDAHFSMYYEDVEQQINDIDMIDIDTKGENYTMYKNFVNHVIDKVLY